MTRILFGSMPRTDHVRPALPLARRLVAEGHQVTWYTGASYPTEVSSTGAIAVPMSAPLDCSDASIERMHAVAHPKPGVAAQKWAHRHVSLDPIPGWLRELEQVVARARPQMVVVEHGFLAGLFLAEKLGLPSVAFSARHRGQPGPADQRKPPTAAAGRSRSRRRERARDRHHGQCRPRSGAAAHPQDAQRSARTVPALLRAAAARRCVRHHRRVSRCPIGPGRRHPGDRVRRNRGHRRGGRPGGVGGRRGVPAQRGSAAEDIAHAVHRVLDDPRFRRRARALASGYAEAHGLLAADPAITGLVEPHAASAASRHAPGHSGLGSG